MNYRIETIKLKSLQGTLTLLLLSLFLNIPSQAQGPPLNPAIEAYPPSTFESHPQVFCAARDSLGGMWFGTLGAALHYTGETWEKVPTPMAIFAMDIDDEGRIWVGGQSEFGYLQPVPPRDTINPGLSDRHSPDSIDSKESSRPTGKMKYVSLTHLVSDSLRGFNIVWNVHEWGERVVFNAYNVMFVLEGDRLEALFPKKEFYRSHSVNGELWIQDRGMGLYHLKKGGSYESIPDTAYSLDRLPGSKPFSKKRVTEILGPIPGMIGKREAMVLTRGSGLFRYCFGDSLKEEEKRITSIGKEWLPFFKKAGIYHATPLDPNSNPWGSPLMVSTLNRGAALLDSAGRPVHVLDQKGGMTANSLWRTVKGAAGSGMLWSATDKGIVRWTPGDPRSFAREGKAFSGRVTDITRHRGQLFLSTPQGVYLRREGKVPGRSDWRLVSGIKGEGNDLLCIGEEDGGRSSLLVALANEGLFKLREVQKGPKQGGANWELQKINGKHAYTLTDLSLPLRGEWVAFAGRAGVIVLSREKGQEWQERLHIKGLPEEVYSFLATTSKDDMATNLWVGLRTLGGFRLGLDTALLSDILRSDDHRTFRYEELSQEKAIELDPFTGKGAGRKGLPEGPTKFFPFRDRVIAATDSGLYRPLRDPKDNLHWNPDSSLGCLFGKCSDERKGKVQGVFCLKEAEDGSIWIQGAGRTYHLIPKANGGYRIDSLPFKGMNLGTVRAFHFDRGGITWMGGDNGLVRYEEDLEKDFRRPYRCFIRRVSVPLQHPGAKKRDSMLFGGFYRKPALDDSLLGWKRVVEQPDAYVPSLPYSMNGLTFRYAAPYYEEQKKVEYSHFLEGFDEGWSQWKKETRKEYTNLPEGNYTFKVKAKNVYGVESKVAEYRFRILPPWYRTWTAYGGYTIAGIGFIWLIVRLNSRRLVAQKERLERTVEERTKEIQEEKAKVEKQQKETEKQREEAEKQKQEVERKNEALEEANKIISKQKEEVKEQKERVEEAHEEITQSIDYAQKIQYALLQSEEHVSPHLPDHFILFKPQSQVSGDFYWAREHKGHLYIAAVDCTGHGVPGAFMSMLGISQLNEIMSTDELLTPGQILTDLRNRVVKELSGSTAGETAKDGMDAALLRIPLNNKETKEVVFAGAQNPLYVARKGIGDVGATHVSPADRMKPFKKSSNGIEVKGDPMPVGYDEHASGDFTTVSLQVREGDMLYMFSDGYADQFGGPKGKKFRYGPFKKLLAELHEKPVEEQKRELDRVFEEWKAESQQEQIDDVVVVGVRV